jgi:hypothetical protein
MGVLTARRSAAAVAAALLISAGPARAAFDQPFLTAQSASMGGASLAGSGDPAAIFVNPADTAGLKRVQTYFTYNSLFTGLSGASGMGNGFIATGVPTRIGSLSAGVGLFSAPGLMQERTVSLGFARSFAGVQVGVAAKALSHAFSQGGDPLAANDPVFRSGSARSAASFDAGVSFPLGGVLQAGVAVRNINRPDVGLASEDRVPRQVQAGLALKVFGIRATGDLSVLQSGASTGQAVPAFGLEKVISDGKMAFRLGASTNQISGGFGIMLGRVGLDYALVFHRDLMQNNAGSHTVGLRLEFGGSHD